MRHVPHLVVGAPWEGELVEISVTQWRHVSKVLRMGSGDPVTYTDGRGQVGEGVLANRAIRRGDERDVPRPTDLIVAVAPPSGRHRLRFLVEKLAELGVARLQWLWTRHGSNRAPSQLKVSSWVVSAVEQSRGAWLMDNAPELVELSDLEGPVVVCHPGGGSEPSAARTVAIGPERGFAHDDLLAGYEKWDLGPTVLRVETAAMVAAARILH